MVLRRTMYWKAFGMLYNSLLCFGMTTVVVVLKCDGQNARLIYALAI